MIDIFIIGTCSGCGEDVVVHTNPHAKNLDDFLIINHTCEGEVKIGDKNGI